MLESLVSTLLNRVLGAYVSNLNYSQLQIGIWSGEVVLRNLQLKREALDKLDLPVDVLQGQLGKLTLNIPWSNLKGNPVMIDIQDVYILAVPRKEYAMSAEELDDRLHQQKLRKLANAELVKSAVPSDATEDAKNETFANQLMTKILNNLQFSITNIHVRYEDTVSVPGHRFAAGITLKALSAITTDSNWVPKTIEEAVNTIHKLATLESLAVYWNTDTYSLAGLSEEETEREFSKLIANKNDVPKNNQYILKPVSGTGRVKMSKKYGGDVPKIDAKLLFDELSFIIDDEQYHDAIMMVDLFHSYMKKQKYLHLHPEPDMTPKTHPREYFQFAANAVLSGIHERNAQWTWNHLRETLDDRRAYRECYVAERLGRATPEQLEILDRLERKLSYENIRFYRSIAKSRLKREKAILAAVEERRQKQLRAKQGANASSWLSSWWSGGGRQDVTTPEEDEELVITEEQKQEFYNAIEYDEDKAATAAMAADVPKDTMILSLKTVLSTGSFTIKRGPHSAEPVEVLSLVFDTVVLGTVKYVDAFKATAALGDLRLYDGVTRNTQYRQLIGAKKKAESMVDRRKSSIDPQLLKFASIQDPFFSVVYEHQPLDNRADNAIALTMRNIDIVYNPTIIREVIQFFTPPETSADSINALIAVAGDTFEDIKNQTRVNLELALENHTTLDLRVDMDAPVIVIPEDCTSRNSRGIVIDAGHINVESNLVPPDIIQQIKNKRSTDYTSEDYVRLRSLMYDKFDVHLTQTKILLGDSVDACLEQVRNPRPEQNYLHLIDRIDMMFLVEMCIIRNSKDLTNVKISGHLPLLSVNFSDTKYRTLMQIPGLIEASGLLGSQAQDTVGGTNGDQANDGEKKFELMHTDLWKQVEREYLFDSDSEESDENSSADGRSIAETSMTSFPSQFQQGSSKHSKPVNPNHKVFELLFKVDRVSANILESRSGKEHLLCDLVLQHLSLEYCQRPHDMQVNLSLKSLDVADRMKHGNEFKYLVTSEHDVLQPSSAVSDMDTKDLVNISYIRVDPTSPEYIDKYKGISQTADIALSTLNFIVTRSSVLTLYNFVLNTFATDETPARQKQTSNSPESQRSKIWAEPKPADTPPAERSIRVTLLLDSVNFILNNDGVRLATGELSHGNMTAIVTKETTKVVAKLANFTITDDMSPKREYQKAANRQLLTIQGQELIDFRFETFPDRQSNTYPGYDQSIFVRMGSAQFTILEHPLQQLLGFLYRFAEMKTVYDRARQAALESAQQFQQSSAKTHFDIVINTPVVLFPEMHVHPLDVVVAHLGEIRASNQFEYEGDTCLNAIKAEIRAISLSSKFYHIRPGIEQLQLQTLPVIDNIDLNFDIQSVFENGGPKRPDVDINATITDIRMHLTDRQYTFLLDAANMISRVFSTPPEADAFDTVTSPSSTKPKSPETNQTKEEHTDAPNDPNNDATRIRMSIAVPTMGLDLYMQNPKMNDPQVLMSLSRIALNDLAFGFQMQKNNTMKVDIKVKSVTVNDTRPDVKSKFREIVPATENGHQVEFQLEISAPDPGRYGIAFITVNDPKVVLSLDHAFLLFIFFTRPFGPRDQDTNIVPLPASNEPASSSEASDNGLEIHYRLNIVRPEFILLATPESSSSEAVVLSAESVMISRQGVVALAVRQIGMFLCRMDMRQNSTLRFIQTFDVSLSMNNMMHDVQKTELEVSVDALILRLSYRDAMLITDIFNKAYELYNASAGSSASPKSSGQSVASPQSSPEVQRLMSSVGQTLSHESLRASFQGLQIILIEEIHETPMVDINLRPFSVDVVNWSRSLAADVGFSVYVNYFNIKNSHWEPLLEPWNFKLELSRENKQKTGPLNIKLLSNTELNINLTHTFLESALTTMRLWDKQKDLGFNGERGTIAPYRLRNCTGYRIHVWNAVSGGDKTMEALDDGSEIPWWFEDWRERRETTKATNNSFNIQLEGARWETLRNVTVDTEGEHIYSLRPAIDDVRHSIVFDVKLVDNLKIVTIRSTMLIENRTLLPVDVAILDDTGTRFDGPVRKIAPGEDFALPIEKAYHNRFCVRPDAGFGYTWVERGLSWRDFMVNPGHPNMLKCRSLGEDTSPFIFQVYARRDKSNRSRNYPFMAIRLSAPVEIENLLPYDFNFKIIDKTARQNYNSFLRKGGTAPLHVIENGHLLLFNIQMPDTSYSASEFAIISTRGTDDLEIDDTLQLTSRDNVRLTLRINSIEVPESGGARRYSIYCPYVLINKTDSIIALKPKLAWQNAMFSGGLPIAVCHPSSKPEPFLYSYPKLDNGNRSLIQVSGSEWGQPLSFEAVGAIHDVSLPRNTGVDEVHIGISVQEGQGKFKLTKVITFTPRFVLINHMGESLRYRQPESRSDQVLNPNERVPLYNLRRNNEKQLSVKLPGINNTWSAPFNIQEIGTVHVRLDSADGITVLLMRVTTILQDATVFVILERAANDAWPYALVNNTDEDMSFYQEDPITLRDDYTDVRIQNTRTKRYRLPAHEKVHYSWDMPAVKDKKIILNINGRERSISLQEIGQQQPFRYTKRNGRQAIAAIDVKTEDMVQVLYLSPYVASESYYRPLSPHSASSSTASLQSSSGSDFVVNNVTPQIHFVLEFKFAQIGFSLVNRHLQELAFVTLRDFELKLTDSNVYQSLRWTIKWVQIDNQLYSTMFPILLYPTVTTKDTNTGILPTFQLALDRMKDDSHGVIYVKRFWVLLQEISLEMDEEFIYAVIDFSRLNVEGWNAPVEDEQLWEFTSGVPDVKPHNGNAQLYFESFMIQPFMFNLSFVRTDQVNIVDERPQGNSPLMYFVNVLTMAIGNINNAPLRFNALNVENLRDNGSDLYNRIFLHYSGQFVSQIHRMIGSADFLGNPVGLFSNLSSGVAELFYEPYQGLIMSDRPHDLGMGLARGFGGFVRKSVFGVSDSFSKFTGSIGKGLSAATMDREYQDRRRMNMKRNRPRHALVGVAQGANSFASSITSGVTGLVTRPIEGAAKEGVGGFITGFGKGLVGAFTKPAVGVFDLASTVTEGIRNSTTSDTNEIQRVRDPRFIGQDGILKPYSPLEAAGQRWLKDVDGGQYFNDKYITHCRVQGNERVAILTSSRLMLIRTRNLEVEWQEPFTGIQTIKDEPTGIAIYLRSQSWEPFLVIPDKSERDKFFKAIEGAVKKYNAERLLDD